MPSVPVFPVLLAGAVAALYVLAPGYFTSARVASTGYPLDAPGHDAWAALRQAPYPPYPFAGHALLERLVPVAFYEASLRPLPPLLFSAVYYLVAHAANHTLGSAPKDATRGTGPTAQLLRAAVVAHNLALALYSAFTFAAMLPPVVDLFVQGWRGSGVEGMKVALCSIPTNDPYLGRWAYLFMLSKYYEVVDSLILHLKGKRIGHLQSYHHAGALICMWVAYRYQSQPVWVFVTFNSGVHTAMYLYYVCAALHLPFPRALKRNLTTLQILQIASGTLLTNVYLLISIAPAHVLSTLATVHTSLPRLFASHTDTLFFGGGPPRKAMALATYAADRATSSVPASCLQTKGAEVALHVNTAYMLPLLALFAHFFISSYLRPSKTASAHSRAKGAVDAPPAPAPSAAAKATESTAEPRPAVPAYVAPPSGRPGERSLKAVPASNRP